MNETVLSNELRKNNSIITILFENEQYNVVVRDQGQLYTKVHVRMVRFREWLNLLIFPAPKY
jgi:hypothetical protein